MGHPGAKCASNHRNALISLTKPVKEVATCTAASSRSAPAPARTERAHAGRQRAELADRPPRQQPSAGHRGLPQSVQARSPSNSQVVRSSSAITSQ